MIKADVLVIGSGISGLSYAIKISERMPEAKIIIVTKADEDESNTKYAQGGLSVVTDFDKDSFQKHIDDTMLAGDGETAHQLQQHEALEEVLDGSYCRHVLNPVSLATSEHAASSGHRGSGFAGPPVAPP